MEYLIGGYILKNDQNITYDKNTITFTDEQNKEITHRINMCSEQDPIKVAEEIIFNYSRNKDKTIVLWLLGYKEQINKVLSRLCGANIQMSTIKFIAYNKLLSYSQFEDLL